MKLWQDLSPACFSSCAFPPSSLSHTQRTSVSFPKSQISTPVKDQVHVCFLLLSFLALISECPAQCCLLTKPFILHTFHWPRAASPIVNFLGAVLVFTSSDASHSSRITCLVPLFSIVFVTRESLFTRIQHTAYYLCLFKRH